MKTPISEVKVIFNLLFDIQRKLICVIIDYIFYNKVKTTS